MSTSDFVTREEFNAVVQNIQQKLEHAEKEHDVTQSHLQSIEKKLKSVQDERDATQRHLQSVESKYQKAIDKMKNQQEAYESHLMVAKAHLTNLELALASRTAQNGLGEHTPVKALIDDIHTVLARTHEHQIKESKIACHCTHTAINENQRKMGKRITQIEQMVLKLKRGFKKDNEKN